MLPPSEPARDGVSRHVAQNIDRIAGLHARAEENVGGHQRFVERLARFVGRPAFFYVLVVSCASWIVLNSTLPALGRHAIDAPPFEGLQCVVGLVALIALVEELRVDLPNVHDRRDDEAAAMTEPADPAAVVAALKETLPDGET